MKPRVYSYTRFSTPEQALGDSERRQVELAKGFAQSKGLTLDEDLRMLDAGISGFHGAHRTKGALGKFLQKVESGDVPKGSILVVENLDRLGREPVTKALKSVVFALVEHGITIETLSPPFTYTTESINDGGIWQLVAYIMLSHSESKKKSERGKANWAQKRKLASNGGPLLTKRCPAWLQVVDGQFKVIAKAAKAVEAIYRLKLEGFGKLAIEKRMNASAPWTPPCGWRSSYIDKILRTPAVIGEFQPCRSEEVDGRRKRPLDGDPIPNYYPAVIAPKLYHAVQQRMSSNKGTGGRTGKARNVFQNLCRCGYCGGSVVLLDLGSSPYRRQYLVCDNGRRGLRDAKGNPVCRTHSVRYDEFEATMLDNLAKLRPETVLPNADEQTKQAQALRETLAGIAGEVADIEAKVCNLVSQIASTSNPAMRGRYEKLAADLEGKRPALEAERTRLEGALRELERGSQSFERWQRDLAGLKAAIAKDIDSRIRLKTHLKEFVARIDIYAKGHESNVEHALALCEQLPDLERSKHFPAFRRFMRGRLLSPTGRFFRLHLRTAKPESDGVPIAPADSLAHRVEIRGKDWTFKGPELSALLKEFFNARKPGFVPKAGVM